MPDPSRLRDSTQVVLPRETFEAVREDVEAEFTVTVVDEGEHVRLVGSPVVVEELAAFLVRRGVGLP